MSPAAMSDLETQLSPRTGEQIVSTLRVEVVDGPDRGKHVVAGELVSVGTARDNALAVGDFTVSRYHLDVSVRPGGILVTDLGSTNGTYIGAVRVERAIVPPGTLLKLGGTTIRFDDAVRRAVPAPGRSELAGMIAVSPQMVRLFADIERVAQAPTSVLIVGESGTGKERVAEALHARSTRAAAPLVTIDCGALSSSLLASELFGHERGSFTGADRTHKGAFERAENGTVFLDEIGELPSADQSALLGVLERRRFRRVGGSAELDLEARVIAATNRDLRAMVADGRFREDLFYRIHVLSVTLPALRDRRDDVPVLLDYFLGRHRRLRVKRLAPECAARMYAYPGPGNVRELENEIERLVVLAGDAPTIGAELLSPRIRQWMPTTDDAPTTDPASLPAAVEALERKMIGAAMRRHGGNKTRAAEELKVSRRNLIRLVQKYELE